MSVQRNIKVLAWFNFFTDFRFYNPVAILYFAHITGSYALGMSVFSVVYISSAVFELPTGILSDYIGRRNTAVLGAFSSVLYAILYAIGGSFAMLAIGAIFEGLSRSFYSGNNNALLHDSLKELNKENDYHTYLGKTSSSGQVALGVSGLLGGVIAYFSFSLVFWLSVIPQLICLVLSFGLVESKIFSRQSGNIYAHLADALYLFKTNTRLRMLAITSIIKFGLSESTWQFQAAFYKMVWPVWAIGMAKTLSNIGAALSFYFSGKLINRFGALPLLMFDSIYSRIVNVIALLFPSPFSPVLMSSNSFLYGSTEVSKNTLLQKEFTDKQRATMGSLISFGGSIFFAIFAYFLGYVGDKLGVINVFLLMQLFQFVPMFLYYRIFTNHSAKK